MMTNSIGGLTANNAAYSWMGAANSLMSFKGNSTALQLSMLNDSLRYKAGLLMQESQDKVQKENIKRSFSIFA
jgi:hypothetical protein